MAQFRHPELSKVCPASGVTDVRYGFDGLCLFANRLESSHSDWLEIKFDSVYLKSVQIAMLFISIDGRPSLLAYKPTQA